jgi:hypothetical protein
LASDKSLEVVVEEVALQFEGGDDFGEGEQQVVAIDVQEEQMLEVIYLDLFGFILFLIWSFLLVISDIVDYVV